MALAEKPFQTGEAYVTALLVRDASLADSELPAAAVSRFSGDCAVEPPKGLVAGRGVVAGRVLAAQGDRAEAVIAEADIGLAAARGAGAAANAGVAVNCEGVFEQEDRLQPVAEALLAL